MDDDLLEDARKFIKSTERTGFLSFFAILSAGAFIIWWNSIDGVMSHIILLNTFLGAGIFNEVLSIKIMIARQELRKMRRRGY